MQFILEENVIFCLVGVIRTYEPNGLALHLRLQVSHQQVFSGSRADRWAERALATDIAIWSIHVAVNPLANLSFHPLSSIRATQEIVSTYLGLRYRDVRSFLTVFIVEFLGVKYSVHYSLIYISRGGKNCGGIVCGQCVTSMNAHCQYVLRSS